MKTTRSLVFGALALSLSLTAGCEALNSAARDLNRPAPTPDPIAHPNGSGFAASSTPTDGDASTTASTGSTTTTSSTNAPAAKDGSPPSQVAVNGKTLSSAELDQLATQVGSRPAPGSYWYDPTSGLFGLIGHGTGGVTRPGLAFPPPAQGVSNGDTSILINGREITRTERDYLIRIFGGDPGNVYQYVGAYDLDAKGNLSKNGAPLGNVVQRAKAAQSQSVNTWQTKSGVSGGSGPGCSWVYIPNSTTGTSTSVMSGCD